MKNVQKEVEWLNNRLLKKIKIKKLLISETGKKCSGFYHKLNELMPDKFTREEINKLNYIKGQVQKSILLGSFEFVNKSGFVEKFLIPALSNENIRSGSVDVLESSSVRNRYSAIENREHSSHTQDFKNAVIIAEGMLKNFKL